MSINTYRKIKFTNIRRYHPDEGIDTDSAFRVYKSSPAGVTLQVRGPELLKNHRNGKYGIIASASLNVDELTALRDGINASLNELGK